VVTSFKHPSAVELQHDFLWRATGFLPQRGKIGIFNRSHYEEVLIVKVRPEILAAERLPAEALAAKDFWQQRYQSIVDFEEHLSRNGTRIVKFFMHLSREEQRKRLLRRLEDPSRYWKFSPDDLEQRSDWAAYQRAYAECLSATSTDAAPWYVVPADDKKSAHRLISQVLVDLLEGMALELPRPDPAKAAQLREMRRGLRGKD
jgi:PPK2 family polyphosphate:nucleotide phosphotransferase